MRHQPMRCRVWGNMTSYGLTGEAKHEQLVVRNIDELDVWWGLLQPAHGRLRNLARQMTGHIGGAIRVG